MKGVFHDLFAGQFAAREVIEYQLAMVFVKLFSLRDPGYVVVFQLKPPIGFQFVKSLTSRQLSASFLETNIPIV